jgi:hypothetical protein
MKNDFTTIFRAIKPIEQEGFSQYVHFFYKPQKAVLKVFSQVVKSTKAHDEELFSLTDPDHKNTLNALSDLKRWLLEFLTIQEIKSNSYESKFLTLEALRKRGLKEVLTKKSTQLNQELMEHKSPDIWLTLLKLRLSHTDYFNTDIDKLKDYQELMHHLLDDLDNFYIGTKLKYSAELQSRADILKENYKPRLLDEILTLVQVDDSINPIVRNLYFPLLELIKDKSEAAYEALKSFLIKDKAHDRSEKLAVLLYLLNFAAHSIRQGDERYHNECLDLAKIGLVQSLFTAAGYFPTGTFNNIVNFGSHLKQYQWTDKFIDDWSIHLKPDDRPFAVNLAKARISFELKNFDKTIELLALIVNHKNIAFSLNVRTLLARAYYEQKATKSLQIHHCEALYQYVYRNKNMGDNLKESSLNFVKILRFLINKKPKKQLDKVLEKTKTAIICYDWLKAKIEERKK